MKFKTLYDGEKAILVKQNGRSAVIEGPKRIFLCLDKLEKLRPYTANINQYLVVKHIDGNVVHVRGPAQEWFNRLVHEQISVHDLLQLNSSQMILVYSRDDKNNDVQRRIVQGPCVFMPEANEWLHPFSWHSEDPAQIGHVTPNSAKFTVLTVQPDFFNYYVKEVRTLDDTLLTIKVMVIYELTDVFKMLDTTQDPISDFINAICADVVSFVGKFAFSEFLNESHQLNNVQAYVNLLQRASRIGFVIKSIIYNGYHSSNVLQDIQDDAIQRRTEIRLNNEINKEKERCIDLRVERENQRLKRQIQLNELKNTFLHKLNAEHARHLCGIEDVKFENEEKLNEIIQNNNTRIKQLENEVEEEYLKYLQDYGVDIDKYVKELADAQHRVDSQYQLIA